MSGGLLAKSCRNCCVRIVRTKTPFRGEDSQMRFTFYETHLGMSRKSKFKQSYKRFTPLKMRFTDLSAAPWLDLADLRFIYRETITWKNQKSHELYELNHSTR
jgi:hypothetical protein